MTNIVLPSGTYRYSVGLNVDMNYYPIGSVMVFPSQLSNVQGAFINNETDGAYPTSLLNVQTISGFFWFYDNISKIITTDIKCNSINNLSPLGGVYMLTSEANSTIFNSTLPYNMLNTAPFVGSLSFDGFSVSSYHLKMIGVITISNNASLTIKLFSNDRTIGVMSITSMPALSGSFYEININFSIRKQGNFSNTFTNLELSYNSGNNILGNRQISIGSIDTTVSNTLAVTIETPNGAIGWQQVKQCILTKVY